MLNVTTCIWGTAKGKTNRFERSRVVTGGPSSKCEELSFFFLLLCERSAKGDMYGIYYYVTTEFDYAKRDSSHAAYGGVVLQRFELIKVCVGTVGTRLFCLKSQLFLYFVTKIYLPCCSVVFFVVLPFPQVDLTRFRRVVKVLLVSTTKRKTRLHTDFWSAHARSE